MSGPPSIANRNYLFRQDCPRCGTSKSTFDVLQYSSKDYRNPNYVLFCRCRQCFEATNFDVFYSSSYRIDSLEEGFYLDTMLQRVALQDPALQNTTSCPDFVPEEIKSTFKEASTCLAIGCYNGAGAMFRKTVDLATKAVVPNDETQRVGDNSYISWKVYKDLRLRIDWLLEKGLLERRLEPLIECVREDGNDAAHAYESLDKNACLDLLDFTIAILETVFTEPGRIAESIRRRDERRGKA